MMMHKQPLTMDLFFFLLSFFPFLSNNSALHRNNHLLSLHIQYNMSVSVQQKWPMKNMKIFFLFYFFTSLYTNLFAYASTDMNIICHLCAVYYLIRYTVRRASNLQNVFRISIFVWIFMLTCIVYTLTSNEFMFSSLSPPALRRIKSERKKKMLSVTYCRIDQILFSFIIHRYSIYTLLLELHILRIDLDFFFLSFLYCCELLINVLLYQLEIRIHCIQALVTYFLMLNISKYFLLFSLRI